MKCPLCSKEMDRERKIKIRGGSICENCLKSFPESIQRFDLKFTAKQLDQVKTIYRKPTDKPRVRCGRFGLTKDAVQLNGFEYPLSKLKSLQIGFHPNAMGRYPNSASGTATIILETKRPHMVLEEPFLDHDITARYQISGVNISYTFSKEISQMVYEVNRVLEDGTCSLARYFAKCDTERQKREYEKQKKKQREQQDREKRKEKRQEKTAGPTSPLEAAKKRFGLESPYSPEQVKRARNKILIKEKIHPDDGGSNEKFKILEEEYQLLLRYAAS